MASELSVYLSEIGRIPLLTPDEEILHGTAVREWLDWPGGPEEAPRAVQRRGRRAKERMVSANLRLVVAVAKKQAFRLTGNPGLEMIDLIQEGTIGLVRGVEKFDPTRGYKFSTFGYWWIRQGIGRALQEKGGVVKVPVHSFELLAKMKTTAQGLAQELGRFPTEPELAEALGTTEAQLQALKQVMVIRNVASLDAPIGLDSDSPISRGDAIADQDQEDPLEKLNSELMWAEIQSVLAGFTERDRAIVERAVLGEERHGVIGKDYGISRAAISALKQKTMLRLRQHPQLRQLAA